MILIIGVFRPFFCLSAKLCWMAKNNIRCLIINLSPEGAGVRLLAQHGNVLRVEQSIDSFPWMQFIQRAGHSFFFSNVVVSADPTLVYTPKVPISIPREHPSRIIESGELESALGNALTGAMNSTRRAAGEYLGVNDIDAVLVDARLRDISADGHPVVTPVGLKAISIEGALELTYTTRAIASLFEKSFKSSDFAVVSKVRARFRFLRRVLPQLKSLVIAGEQSSLLLEEDDSSSVGMKRKVLFWHPRPWLEELASAWHLTPSALRELLARFSNGTLSPRFSAVFSEVLERASGELHSELVRAKAYGNVFVDSPLPVFYDSSKRGVSFETVNRRSVIQSFGFIPPREELSMDELYESLAPYTQVYYDTAGAGLNLWLRRRVHWLAPHNNARLLFRKNNL